MVTKAVLLLTINCNIILSATSNFWDNIQIVKTYIFKYNILNSVSFIARYLDIRILYCCFRHISDKVMYSVLNNVEDTKKIHFSTQKYICYSCTLRKVHQYSFFENPVCSSELLGLIHLNLFELSILSYSKYK